MLPNQILKSTYLDLIFEHQNKNYGAYQLRLHYNKRLLQSLFYITTLVAILLLVQAFKTETNIAMPFNILDSVKLVNYVITKDDKKITTPKPKNKIQHNKAATSNAATPIIVEDKLAKDSMSTVDKILNSIVDVTETPGDSVTTDVNLTKTQPALGIGNNLIVADLVETENNILVKAEIMPEFPGGEKALIKYLQKNLEQPTNFEENEKIIVVAQFIISKTGEILEVEIINKGRQDLDAEVKEVLSKMPHWKPGMQNGNPVAVYYKVPVTFVYQN